MRKHPRPVGRATALVIVCGLSVSVVAANASATTEPPDVEPTETTEATATTAAPTTAAPTTAAPTTAAPTTAAPTTAAPTTAAPTTVPIEVERQPLTGVPIDGTLITYTPRPALVVKIDNVGPAIPQAGLNQADIVFEEIVEGATRFAAVFNSQDSDPVGPIRSGRTQDVDLLASFNDPVFAYSGGNAGVNAALAATGWTLLTEGNGMFRVSGRGGSPHNLFGNTTDFFAQAGDAGDASPQFQYIEPGTEVNGSPVASVAIRIGGYNVGWDWDAEQGLFLRSQNGGPHQLGDGQASANTVIVMLVAYGTSAAARNSPEAQTVGSGDVVVYSDGRKIEGTWTRSDASAPFSLEAGGEPVLLVPGRTWVELADADNFDLSDT